MPWLQCSVDKLLEIKKAAQCESFSTFNCEYLNSLYTDGVDNDDLVHAFKNFHKPSYHMCIKTLASTKSWIYIYC